MTDEWDELEDALDQEYPETVILNDETPTVIGQFVRVDTGPSDYGPTPIFVLRTKEGKEIGIWGFHAVLRNQFAQQQPKAGQLVGVRYLGKKTGGSGREYSNYRVHVWRGASDEVDWSRIGDGEVDTPGEFAPATDRDEVIKTADPTVTAVDNGTAVDNVKAGFQGAQEWGGRF